MISKTAELLADIILPCEVETAVNCLVGERDSESDKMFSCLIVTTEMSKAVHTNAETQTALVDCQGLLRRELEEAGVSETVIRKCLGMVEAVAVPAKLAMDGRYVRTT